MTLDPRFVSRLTEAQQTTLTQSLQSAEKALSPTGLQDFLAGAHALIQLGRGEGLVLAYLNEVPEVARQVGEDLIDDIVTAAMKLSSMTSGEVIKLMLESLTPAARHLGDGQLLRTYLTLLHQLASTAARGLRPMLAHIDELLSKLTLSGLRRWSQFGANAYRRDFAKLTAYFDLATSDSRAMLESERRGTRFVQVQRKLNFYLRALWGRDFFLKPMGADDTLSRPYIDQHIMYLPDALDDIAEVNGVDVYRAAMAHMAAHQVYGQPPLNADGLSPAQLFFIGFIEDARVEALASASFPGLRALWRSLIAVGEPHKSSTAELQLIECIAAALLDGQSTDDPDIDAIVHTFGQNMETKPEQLDWVWALALQLHHLLAKRRMMPSLRLLERIRIPYRDDNRIVFEFSQFDWLQTAPGQSTQQVRKQVSVIDMANEVDCELAGDDAQEIWTCSTEMRPYEDDLTDNTLSFNQLWGKEPISPPFYYGEWDYQLQLTRPDWVTLTERRQPKASAEVIEQILLEYRPVAHQIKRIIDMLTPQGVVRQRNLEDGDEIDLNAAIDAMVAIRMGEQPNPRITRRNVIHNRDLAVVLLLDLSESTNDRLDGSDKTILDLTREASTLLATAIQGIGDPFAIHGFSSDGRDDVQYYRFKDFTQPFNDEAKARLAGMQGGLSTRMGAALRHAGQHLLKQAEQRKLILLVTDGEPADIDVRDPNYLRQDSKKAVEQLHSQGVQSYCLSLDARADHYVKQIFGANHYTIIDRVEKLPEELPLLFAGLTR
ncbi:MAG: VWA domain-containing protein [Gammaproteobacteria bacterium]|nr:VWA domain-containing protein [Gammaproteobacteria bacterium]